jgi:hypothetical protein
VGDVDLSIAAALVEMSKSARAERLRVGAAVVSFGSLEKRSEPEIPR